MWLRSLLLRNKVLCCGNQTPPNRVLGWPVSRARFAGLRDTCLTPQMSHQARVTSTRVGEPPNGMHFEGGRNGWVIFFPLLQIFHLPMVKIKMGRAGQHRGPERTRGHMGKKWLLQGPGKKEIKGSLNNSHLDQSVSGCHTEPQWSRPVKTMHSSISLPHSTHNFQHTYLANGWIGGSLLAERLPAYQITVYANP